MDSKELEEYSLVKNKHRTLNGGQKKIVLGGPKEEEARKVLRMVTKAFRKVVFALTNQNKVKGMNSTCTEAEARIRKEKGKETAYHQSGLISLGSTQ